MKKSELIKKLEAIPGDPEVCVYDFRKNVANDDGEGCGAGIYDKLDIDLIENEEDPEFIPWIGIGFANEDFPAFETGMDFHGPSLPTSDRKCRVCGCTDDDCRQCIEKTGFACHWVEADLCSACKEVKSGFQIKNTDKVFYDSPSVGHPDCLCSRCLKPIPEEESPILRVWPTAPGDLGYDPEANGGTEFRYCHACSKEMGIHFGGDIEETPVPDF